MAKRTWSKWGVGMGLLGSLALVGATMISAPRTADATPSQMQAAQRAAQTRPGGATPTPTPGGADLARGRAVFDRACGRCHPGGEEDIGPRVRGVNLTEARVTQQIRQGVGRMRPIPATRLPDADMPALMAYLRSINTVR